ncbi:hypothetical protein [Pseudonocardia sp.]|uniref:hypothetical protein n=1 Tax=Pseudonocardia sp. TaxID=60912 RepID=UPI00260964AE|nr:hypothetical protein [Pseudonocardia sp.]
MGSILVRDAQFTHDGPILGDAVYQPGDVASLQVTIVYEGRDADWLASISSAVATAGEIVGETHLPGGQTLTAGYDQPIVRVQPPNANAVDIHLLGITEPIRAGRPTRSWSPPSAPATIPAVDSSNTCAARACTPTATRSSSAHRWTRPNTRIRVADPLGLSTTPTRQPRDHEHRRTCNARNHRCLFASSVGTQRPHLPGSGITDDDIPLMKQSPEGASSC